MSLVLGLPVLCPCEFCGELSGETLGWLGASHIGSDDSIAVLLLEGLVWQPSPNSSSSRVKTQALAGRRWRIASFSALDAPLWVEGTEGYQCGDNDGGAVWV